MGRVTAESGPLGGHKVEGSEKLRQRGIHRKNNISKSEGNLDSTLPSGKGKQSAEMAGSTRIIRYVLFAFFVSGLPAFEMICAKCS